ncbi:2-dehydropantoate 2-reductase [Thalassotalea sp. LPB0316]|uniref:ketopantoate reductase family protein n=1 Tax=Thalassotalea sp. LPB0316 TaxID=2769490 RepID=UPI0018669E4A|nr:2-dehydropantoate 2-reductase [Thalassotalea sp. LPB0316]QOL26877.1 2-dehydropantoate 2-reductase [Thalassotalea sp. LPB0316]
MNTVIIGSGAIGLLLYQQLIKILPSRRQLALVSRQAEKPSAYQYQALNGEIEQISLNHATHSDINNADLIIVCVKAFAVNQVIDQYIDQFKPSATIVLAHNGMGVYEALKDSIKQKFAIYSLLTTHGSKKMSYWEVTHTGMGTIDFGPLNEINPSAQINTNHFLTHHFNRCSYHHNIRQMQWQKLAINCVINPITAIYQIKNGDVLQAQFDDLRTKLISEFVTIARLAKLDFSEQAVNETVEQVARQTAENTSSMLSDVLAGRETEIEFINGYLVYIACLYQQEELAHMHLAMLKQVKSLFNPN